MTITSPRPFPVAPDFDATDYDQRAYRASMREAWLDRADAALHAAQEAAQQHHHLLAQRHMLEVTTALDAARRFAPREA